MIPKAYQIQQVMMLAGYPKYKKHNRTYECGCPICHEGTSWNKKSRFTVYEDTMRATCFNCGWSGSIIDFIIQVTGKTYREILNDSKDHDTVDITQIVSKTPEIKNIPKLPEDSINLLDINQIEYYKSNKIVQQAIRYLHSRRLLSASNRCKEFWLSLKEGTHKNRIIIPFYANNRIEYYQSRSFLLTDTAPKYLSKSGAQKILFNIDHVKQDLPYIFLCEGPINAMFIKNGVGVAGITVSTQIDLSELQRQQIEMFPHHKQIWVLDSQWVDQASYTKTRKLLEQKINVFIWPKEMGLKYKDINEWAINEEKDELPSSFIVNNTYSVYSEKEYPSLHIRGT